MRTRKIEYNVRGKRKMGGGKKEGLGYGGAAGSTVVVAVPGDAFRVSDYSSELLYQHLL